jgi:hypothetical protein
MAFDLGSSSSTSAEQTTQTVSGSGRGVTGRKNQYTETGALSVGQGATYTEAGGLTIGKGGKNLAKGSKDLSGAQVQGNLNVTDTTTGFNADDVAGIITAAFGNAPISAGGAGASVANNPADPASATTQTTTSTDTSETNSLKLFWQNLPAWKKYTAVAAALFLIWFLFLRKR